ncbi:MAG: hypothetical protein Q7T16_01710 [Candidatus Burarchaeum sp.]|nr:hypothetical protein [Candidatus Burarchaeum sp.]MDO8339351.1 hypothetical protein [Candidatus Burarchaeum sp.]
MNCLRAFGVTILLLTVLSSFSFAYANLNPLAIPAKLEASVSVESPQIYGTAALFKCIYTGTEGQEIPNADCFVLIDGKRNTASRGTTEHSYGEIVSAGQHSWYCACSAKGYEAKESSPTLHVVLPAQQTADLRDSAVDAVNKAEVRLADAKDRGEATADAEKVLSQAKDALMQGDFRLANTLVDNEKLLSGAGARNTLGDLGLLIVPMLFIGVVVVAMLFIFIRK